MRGRVTLLIAAVVAPIAFVGLVVVAPMAFLALTGQVTLTPMPIGPILWAVVPTWVVAQVGTIVIIRREVRLVRWLRGEGYGSAQDNDAAR